MRAGGCSCPAALGCVGPGVDGPGGRVNYAEDRAATRQQFRQSCGSGFSPTLALRAVAALLSG